MKRLRGEKGQALVETALVLPLVLLLIFGIIDYGWLFYNKLHIENCAREGARYAAVQYDIKDKRNSEKLVTRYINNKLCPSNLTFAITVKPKGDHVVVTIDTDVPVLTPIIGAFYPDNKCHMESSVTMHREIPDTP